MNLKKLTAAALTALALGAATLPASAQTYQFDTKGAHAFIQFSIQHLGYSWLNGRFNKFDGQFTWDEANPNASSVEVVVEMDSIDSMHAERDKHLRSEDFLDVERFEEAAFHSTRVEVLDGGRLQVFGDFTLHGVTRGIVIDVEKVGEGKDPWGGYRVGFTGAATIALRDFGIDYDLGPTSTHVLLRLDVEGIRL